MRSQSQLLLGALAVVLVIGCNESSTDSDAVDGVTVGFTPNEITLKESGELKELLDDKLVFVDPQGNEWVAPKGTLTDGASVPRLALWVTDGRFDSRFLKAAIVHDAYCQSDNQTRCPQQFRKRPWRAVHRMFREACLAGGTPETTANLMFAGVWLGGPRWDDPESDLRVVPDEVLRAGYDGCKEWIEENQPTPEEIESWMQAREPTVVAVSRLQNKGIAALDSGDMATAESTLEKSEQLLDESLSKAPDDVMLLNLKGYHHKDLAAKFREKGMEAQAQKHLEDSERTFRKVISNKHDNPSALNGLGRVMVLRDDLDQAEKFMHQALKAEPNFRPAKNEIKKIEKNRRSRPGR
jgi:tetratricopeptide (TPR) repeat protein